MSPRAKSQATLLAEHRLERCERLLRAYDRDLMIALSGDTVKAALIAIWPESVIPDLTPIAGRFLEVVLGEIGDKRRLGTLTRRYAAAASEPAAVEGEK